MLGKLIKHEWKAIAKPLAIMHIALILMAIIGKVLLNIEVLKKADYVWGALLMLYILAVITLEIGTQIYLAVRFYKNMYTDEGYLSFTLPVKSWPQANDLINQVLQVQQMLNGANPAITEGSISRGLGLTGCIAIYNSKGLDLYKEYALNALMIGAVVTDGKEKANDYQLKVGDLSQIDAKKLIQTAADMALSKLGGEPAPTGVYPVVFDPEAMSDLLDTFSGIFDGEAAQKGLSKLQGQEGNAIASDVVTLIDDPFHPENPIPMPFDAEGSPTYKKNIIEKGVLKTLLHNLQSANMAGLTTTGNAYKGKYDSPVGINPFTMHIAPGVFTEEQLLEKAGTGVYIRSLSGLHAGANAITGDFSLQSEGYKSITAVANNLTIPSPTGITTYGSPSVLVENLSVAGK